MISHIQDYLKDSISITQATLEDQNVLDNIREAAKAMIRAIRGGATIMACGNGGSMSDAMHFASELSGKYKLERDPYAAMALSDASAMSCIGNDFGYDQIFARQVAAVGRYGDVLLAISTSGGSKNVIEAIKIAKFRGIYVIGLTGVHGFRDNSNDLMMAPNVTIKVPSTITNLIQEQHIKIIHILVELIEKGL